MEDASSLFKKFRCQNVQIIGYVYENTNGLHRDPVWKTQSFLLNGICTVILWRDCFGRGNLRKFFWDTDGKKFQIRNMLIRYPRKKVDSYLVNVDEKNLAGKEQNIDPMWKILMKDVDLGESTSFLDHVYLGCTQRECQTSKDIVDNCRNMFESRISAGTFEKLLSSENLTQTFPHGPMTWQVMQRNAWKDFANWHTKQLNSYTKSQPHALTTTNSRKKKWDLLDNCPKYAHKLF